MYDITTGTGDFIANGVVSHNCFARNTHTYLDLDAGRDFEREIVVKVNVPELLRAELSKPSWKRELVAFGTNTDPYQWAEGKYELMPPMIEALRETETPTSILTKSPLVTRDLDLYLELAEVADVSVNFSVPTLDEKIWRQTEPHTPHPRKRLEAVATFNEAGIPSGRPGRAADARHQRLARAGRGDRLDRRGGGGDLRQRDRAAPAAGGQGGLHVLALGGSSRSRARATTISTRTAPTRRTAERKRIGCAGRARRTCRTTRATAGGRGWRRDGEKRAAAAAEPEIVQTKLF